MLEPPTQPQLPGYSDRDLERFFTDLAGRGVIAAGMRLVVDAPGAFRLQRVAEAGGNPMRL